ncbi:MAG: hypothetical protein ACOC40_01230 [Thermoplasmatota archaeon]
MQAGTAFMLSFIGQQDKTEQVTDILQKVMNYIKPFQKYLSPMGAISVISNAGVLSGDASGMGSFFDEMINNAGEKLGDTVNYMLDMVFGDNGMFSAVGLSGLSISTDLPEISFTALKNFAQASGIYEGGIKLLIDIACSIDTAELANWVTDGLLVGFSLIAISMGIAGSVLGTMTRSGAIAIMGEIGSLLLTVIGIFIDSVGLAIGSFFWTLINCFIALCANAIEGSMPGIVLTGGVFIIDMASLVTYAASKT